MVLVVRPARRAGAWAAPGDCGRSAGPAPGAVGGSGRAHRSRAPAVSRSRRPAGGDGEPGVDAGQQTARHRGRGGRAAHRHPGQLRQVGVGQALHQAGDLVLRGQPATRTAAGRRRPARPGCLRASRPASGTSAGSAATPRATLDAGQTSSVISAGGEPLDQLAGRAPRPHRARSGRRAAHPGRPGRWPGRTAPRRAGPAASPTGPRSGTPRRSRRPRRAARRCSARTRSPRARRTGRPAGPGSAPPAGAWSGWPR